MMDTVISILSIAIGAVALYFGANWLVDGAIALALRYGVSRIIVGLTIVALGTSSPEAVLSFITSLEGANQLPWGTSSGPTSPTSTWCWASPSYYPPSA
jgi:cation:H+ antiporter